MSFLATTEKGSTYLYIRDSGAWKYHQSLWESGGNDGDLFGQSVAISGKPTVVRATWNNNGNCLNDGAVYAFTPQGETLT